MEGVQKSGEIHRGKIKEINEQIHYAGQYLANKPVFAQMLKTRNKKKFRQEHRAKLELYESAVKFFKKKNADGKIPSMKSLKAEKEKLTVPQIMIFPNRKTGQYMFD